MNVLFANVSESALLGAVALAILGTAGGMWWRLQKSIRVIREQCQAQVNDLEAGHQAKELVLKQRLDDAEVASAALSAVLDGARQDAGRAAAEAAEVLRQTQAELAEARALAAQLPVLQASNASFLATQGALQSALDAEKGRASALEQALAQATRRADNIEVRLKVEESTRAEVESRLLQELQQAAAERERLGGADQELLAMRVNHEEYCQQAEARISNLQRQLTAAEARAALVQKEFMSAVGVTPATPAAAATGAEDRRVRELEQKISQLEAEARKRAREDGYKIAELEFRLEEARDELIKKQAAHEAPNPAINEAHPVVQPIPNNDQVCDSGEQAKTGGADAPQETKQDGSV